jgi:hypothetical protein
MSVHGPRAWAAAPNSYSSINPSSANASGSFTPPTNSPFDRPGEGFHPIRSRCRPRRRPPCCLHHFVSHPAKEEGIGLVEVLDGVTMQVFVREHCTMIAAPVQCDVDGVPKRSRHVRVPLAIGPLTLRLSGRRRGGPLKRLSLADLRHTIKRVHQTGLERILRANDPQAIMFDQPFENLGAMAQVIR